MQALEDPPKADAAQSPVPFDFDLLVDCGSFRYVALLLPGSKWIDPFNGEEVKNVISWTEYGVGTPMQSFAVRLGLA